MRNRFQIVPLISRTPIMNAFIESYHRILDEECLSRHEFGTFAEDTTWLQNLNIFTFAGDYILPALSGTGCVF